ncbi:FAD-dependent oxidoreductase [Rubellimicrobium rubrum]|uniref:FAD-dependent oxidoreductase n=1 Tax=Rubellimicrobium rubrum TaxID=2585369 RepID=A0A5C4N640_9RHOB|nr:FAD-dependent oxidoreductase [Rubellimicrobium rubrum]TNC52512.1 FAD-dependent oxidoreductase [Rubellimicrobium rubrum]
MREVIVIGGGLAGAAMATHLAQAGRDVVLLERSAGPHDKVCGEFLSFEAQEELTRLGIDLRGLGAAPIDTVAVRRGRSCHETLLGFEALSLSRRILDEALLGRAVQAGAEVLRGARATTAARDGTGWAVGMDGGAALRGRHLVLATGKHDLRGWQRPPGRQPDLIGLKMYWRMLGGRVLSGRVELHLFPGGYAGIEMVEGGRANLCLVVREAAFAALGRRWDALLEHLLQSCPGLASLLAGAAPCEEKPLAVARIPYGLVQERSDGPWRLGDQAAVIPSFTGEGMSIALHSARLAATCLADGQGPEAFQRRLATDLRQQVGRSTLASKALVAPLSQALAGRLLTPTLLRWVLHGTRIPDRARGTLADRAA